MPQPLQPQLLPVPSIRHRIEAFLERIAPLYPDLQARGPRRHAALKRLQRLCEREVNILRSQHTLATVKLYLSSYRAALRVAVIVRYEKGCRRKVGFRA